VNTPLYNLGLLLANIITEGMAVLNDSLEPEINEYYLMHGTSNKFVQSIEMLGIDSRFAGDKTMFGRGAYYAESSTKADQYAGNLQVLIPMFCYTSLAIFYSVYHRL